LDDLSTGEYPVVLFLEITNQMNKNDQESICLVGV